MTESRFCEARAQRPTVYVCRIKGIFVDLPHYGRRASLAGEGWIAAAGTRTPAYRDAGGSAEIPSGLIRRGLSVSSCSYRGPLCEGREDSRPRFAALQYACSVRKYDRLLVRFDPSLTIIGTSDPDAAFCRSSLDVETTRRREKAGSQIGRRSHA